MTETEAIGPGLLQALALEPARHVWKRHPAVRSDSQLTFGERAAGQPSATSS